MDDVSFLNEIENLSLDSFLRRINEKNENVFDEWHDNSITDQYHFQEGLKYSLDCINGQLNIIHVNIVSLLANFDKLEELLFTLGITPDIICLSETRLKNYHNDSYIPALEGYDFYRKDSKSAAGGVGIYVNSNLDVKIRDDLELKTEECEDIWLQIRLSNQKQFVTAAIYRHPVTIFKIFNMLL